MWDSASITFRARRKGQQLCQHSSPIHVSGLIMTTGSQNHGIRWWMSFFSCSGPASLFRLCRAGEEMGISSPDPSADLKVRGEAPKSDGIQQNSPGWTSASKGFPRQTFRLLPPKLLQLVSEQDIYDGKMYKEQGF